MKSSPKKNGARACSSEIQKSHSISISSRLKHFRVHPVYATKVKRIRKSTIQKRWDDKAKSFFWRCTICFRRLRSRSNFHWYHTKSRFVLKLFRCKKCSSIQILPVHQNLSKSKLILSQTSTKIKSTFYIRSKSNSALQPEPGLGPPSQKIKFKCSNCGLSKEKRDKQTPNDNNAILCDEETYIPDDAAAAAADMCLPELKAEMDVNPIVTESELPLSQEVDEEESAWDQNLNIILPKKTVQTIIVQPNPRRRKSLSPDISSFRCNAQVPKRSNNNNRKTKCKSSGNDCAGTGTGIDAENEGLPQFQFQPQPKKQRSEEVIEAQTQSQRDERLSNFISGDIMPDDDDRTEFINGDVVDCSDLHRYLSMACEQIFEEAEPDTGQTDKIVNAQPHIVNLVHQCNHCTQQFQSSEELQSHVPVHFGDRPHVCVECGQGFKYLNGLRVHQVVHRSDTPYNCPDCDRSFKAMSYLKTHMLIHSELRQFVCKYCGKSFKQGTILINHQKIHFADKPYKCDVCGNAFKVKSTLERHILTHSDEKRFSCQYCNKKFKRSDAMKAHERIHVAG